MGVGRRGYLTTEWMLVLWGHLPLVLPGDVSASITAIVAAPSHSDRCHFVVE